MRRCQSCDMVMTGVDEAQKGAQCPHCQVWNEFGGGATEARTIVNRGPGAKAEKAQIPLQDDENENIATQAGKERGQSARPAHRPKRDLTGLELPGGYVIEEFIAKGGMGSIWRARDIRLNCDVAVKVLVDELQQDPADRAEFTARFHTEAQTLAKVRGHPNLVSVIALNEFPGSDTEEGFPFIVMEYVTGPNAAPMTLASNVQNRSIAPEEVIRQFLGVCDALDFVHKKGILHRDIKPSNVLVDSRGTPRLTDFGIAMAPADVRQTRTNQRMGAASYMAPEQEDARSATERSDIYALGVTLYEMLTGRLPRHGSGAVSNHCKQWGKRLDEVIGKAMAHEPGDRYESVAAFANAVQEATRSADKGGGKEERDRKASPARSGGLAKVVVAFLLVAGGAFFAWKQWGGAAAVDKNNPNIVVDAKPVWGDLAGAIEQADPKKVRDILGRAPELARATDAATGQTPLHLAAMGKSRDVVTEILSRSDVNAKDNKGRTALHYAAEAGAQEMVSLLAGAVGANSAITDKDGKTPAQLASDKGHTEIAKILGEQKFWSALQAKNYRGNPDSLETLLKANPTLPTLKTQEGLTALHTMAERGDKEAVKILLDNNADVNATTENGLTALYLAASGLPAAGLDDPATASAERERAEVVRLLLAKNAASTPDPVTQNSPLHLAAKRQRVDLMQAFIDFKARLDFKARDNKGYTPLHFAAEGGNLEMVRLLLPVSDALAKDGAGHTVLESAAAAGKREVVDELLAGNLKWDQPTLKSASDLAKKGGFTALGDVLAGKLEIPTDSKGLAAALNNFDVKSVNAIVAANKGSAQGKKGHTALHDFAKLSPTPAQKGSVPTIVNALINELGTDVDAQDDRDGDTAAHVAAENGNLDVWNALNAKGANIDLPNKASKTAREIARQSYISWKVPAKGGTPVAGGTGVERAVDVPHIDPLPGQASLKLFGSYQTNVGAQSYRFTLHDAPKPGALYYTFRDANANEIKFFIIRDTLVIQSTVPLFRGGKHVGSSWEYTASYKWDATKPGQRDSAESFTWNLPGGDPIVFKQQK